MPRGPTFNRARHALARTLRLIQLFSNGSSVSDLDIQTWQYHTHTAPHLRSEIPWSH